MRHFNFKSSASCARVLIGFGVIAFGVTALDGDWRGAILAAGSVLIIGAIVRATLKVAVEKVMQPQADVYEAGVEVGYDRGYHDGRRSDRLTVVPIREPELTANL